MIRLTHTQTTSLQQKLAPQLIQSLRMLQMPAVELEQTIQQELEINPLLEIDEDADRDEIEQETEESTEETEDSEEEEVEALDELEFEEADLDKLDKDQFDEEDWDHYLNESGYSSPAEEFDPNLEDRNTDRPEQRSLEDTLLEQLMLTDLSEADRVIGEYLIGNIDEDGFLCSQIEDLSEMLGVEPQNIEQVLHVIQTFEPMGVGARDLRECLIIQLREQGLENAPVMEIVQTHLDDLITRRYSKIIRTLGVSKNELVESQRIISGLNPKPVFAPEPRVNLNLVIPDLEVHKVGEDYIVSLTDGNVPSLRISPIYRTLLSQSEKGGRDAKAFVVNRLNKARWFISAINQRRATMLKVMRCIVENQKEFFDKGIGNLRSMVLQEVADQVNMHVSTISRVSNGKYVQTPHGVFELKYFFDGALSRDDGEDISSKNVKEKIERLIKNEDSSTPLSDRKIADLLKMEGIEIARRTVAKYRDHLKINPARYRKAL